MRNMADNNWRCVNSNNRVVSTLHTFVPCILTADCKHYSEEYQKMVEKYFLVSWECDKNIGTIRIGYFTSDAMKINQNENFWLKMTSKYGNIKSKICDQKWLFKSKTLISVDFQHIRCKDSEPHCSKVFSSLGKYVSNWPKYSDSMTVSNQK